jgi:hypothetical protein
MHHGERYQIHYCEIVVQSQRTHEVTSRQAIQELSITFWTVSHEPLNIFQSIHMKTNSLYIYMQKLALLFGSNFRLANEYVIASNIAK